MAKDTEQLTLSGLHKTETKNIVLTRATKKTITFSHDFGASTNVTSWRYFWRKKLTDDSSETVVLSLSSTNNSSQIDLTTDGVGILTIDDEDTRGLDYTLQYVHGMEFVGTGAVEQAPFVGTANLIYEVVHDDATAPYLSWTTKSTYDANIDALLLCNEASTLSTDAASAAGSIVVYSAAPFSAGDTITIHDGTNTENHDIAAGGISGTTITLDATTLANAYDADETVVVLNF